MRVGVRMWYQLVDVVGEASLGQEPTTGLVSHTKMESHS